VLVSWLNSLPEVQTVLAAEFAGGKPIREQNLSQWRKRGFKQWFRLGKPNGSPPNESRTPGNPRSN
jgi:hypothetical protein